ncbi:MAG: hypothetical protein ABIY70_08835 [Capsulimonas sp.]|uniref:hypothetical protein n=1 Tax=Capsulimonas sp. TaxID=2494211 RepID=UPI0032654CAC
MITDKMIRNVISNLGEWRSKRAIAEQMMLIKKGSISECVSAYEGEMGALLTVHHLTEAKRVQDEAAERAAEAANADQPAISIEPIHPTAPVQTPDEADQSLVAYLWPCAGGYPIYHSPGKGGRHAQN